MSKTCSIARGAFVVLCATAPLAAQSSTAEKEKTNRIAMVRFVPAAAKLFVDLRRPGEVDEALRQAQVWRLWSAAGGRSSNPDKPTDLRTALAQFLGPDPTISVDELMKAEMGLMAPSWSDLSNAVWLVRLPRPNLVDRWFPKEGRQEMAGSAADNLFRTADGMIVGVRAGIVAMARRSDDAALVRELFRLIVGGDGESLQDFAAYRELVAYLPGKSVAVVYWARGAGSAGNGGAWSSLWPPVQHAVVGMSVSDGRIDFAVRAALSNPQPRQALAGHVVDRLLKLPATTLAAGATTMDLNQAFETAQRDGSPDLWAKALSFAAGLRSPGAASTEPPPRLGPHVILAWDQDLGGGSAPQLALLVETKDARRMEAEFEAMVQSLVGRDEQTESAHDPAPDFPITRDTHFGVSIAQASLNPVLEASAFPFAHLAPDLQLSWAAHKEWLIVALSHDHVARILDAYLGMVPTLGGVREVQALRKRRASHTSVFLVQPDLASDVLQGWVTAGRAPSPTKLDPSLFSEPRLAEAVQRKRLGIGMQVDPEPGTVIVARVYPDTAADGLLFPDDRIIGVDGRLLDLASPNADLRRRWAEPSASHGHTFRVQREETTIELFLKRDEPGARPDELLTRSLAAIRDFASALRTIRFTSLTVHPTDERHYSALLSLRIAPSPTSAGR